MHAHLALGHLYLLGVRGVHQAFRLASEHLRSAATQGHVTALYKLGHLALNGVGMATDCSVALQSFRAVMNHALARTAHAGNGLELLVDGNAPAALLEYARAGEMGLEVGL